MVKLLALPDPEEAEDAEVEVVDMSDEIPVQVRTRSE